MSPRLPRLYWGELVYATPGTGKTFVANKYRDVIDFDDLMIAAIKEVSSSGFVLDNHDDPREGIQKYFKYIQFSRRLMNKVYDHAMEMAHSHCENNDVVLLGTRDLMQKAHRLFIQENDNIVRTGFDSSREEDIVDQVKIEKDVPIHYIEEYLDNMLQRIAGGN